jgi:hypothetical protein
MENVAEEDPGGILTVDGTLATEAFEVASMNACPYSQNIGRASSVDVLTPRNPSLTMLLSSSLVQRFQRLRVF